MSSFNDIKKVNYSDNKDSIVSLKEYIVFKDEVEQKKLAIFKFQNNLNQELSKMTFEVMQFDSDNFMIKKTTVNYDNFKADRGEAFVPKMKMELDLFCETIQVNLTYAKFERVELVKGTLKPIPYSINEFRGNKEKPVKPSKKEQKLLEKKRIKELKKSNKESDKRTIEVLDVTKKNKPLVSAVLTVIMSLCLVLFVAATVVIQGLNGKLYTSGSYMYKKLSNNTISIHKYYGSEEDISIPDKIDGYSVAEIDDKAFKKSNCYSITISNPLIIGNNSFEDCSNLSMINGIDNIISIGDKAFRNCTNLNKLSSTELDSVGVRAFENCTSLKNVIIPNASIETEAFKGCTGIVELEIRDTTTNHLIDIFAGEKNNVMKLKISRKNIGVGYFSNMSALTDLEFGVVPNIEFGALTDTNISGHYINESVETLDGKIIAIKLSDEGKITLPKSITDKEQALNFLYDYKTSIHIIETEMKYALDSDDLAVFESLIGFGILNDGKTNKLAISNSSVSKIYWDSNQIINNVLTLPNTIKDIYIGNYDDAQIKLSNQLIDLYPYSIENIYINNVKSVSLGALADLYNIKELNIANYGYFSLSDIGVKDSLTKLNITNKNGNEKLTCDIIGYSNLSEIVFPTNITTLGACLNECEKIVNIVIPSSVTEIGDNFIKNCGITSLALDSTNIKTIGNGFISNCDSINYIVLPNSLISIGKNFAKNCANLYDIELPNKVQKIGSYLINGCASMSYINVPKSVTSLEMPLIGYDCDVTSITTPFVGTSSDKGVQFNKFDLSASNLVYLRVFGNLAVDSVFANNLTNLETFIVDGKITGASSNVFKQLDSLINIKFNGELKCRFVDLFYGKTYMNNVVIDTNSSITDNFFNGMNINALAINSYNKLVDESFSNCTIDKLFIGSNANDSYALRRKGFYERTFVGVSYLFLDIEKPEVAKNYTNVLRSSFNDFVRKYTNISEILN